MKNAVLAEDTGALMEAVTGDDSPEPAIRETGLHPVGFSCVFLTPSAREADLVARLARPAHIRIYHATRLQEAEALLAGKHSRILLTNAAFPGGDWKDALSAAAHLSRPAALVVASAAADDRLWIEVLERGAYDLILKPFRASELCRILENAYFHVTRGGWHCTTA